MTLGELISHFDNHFFIDICTPMFRKFGPVEKMKTDSWLMSFEVKSWIVSKDRIEVEI